MALVQEKPSTIVENGTEWILDRNGIYRNNKGHIKAGQNMSRLKSKKAEVRRKLDKATPADIRRYLRDKLPEVLPVIVQQAIDGCVVSQKLVMDKCMPSLKAVEIDNVNALPTLIINQLLAPTPDGNTNRTAPPANAVARYASSDSEGGTPSLLTVAGGEGSNPDNFVEDGSSSEVSSNSLDISGIEVSSSTQDELSKADKPSGLSTDDDGVDDNPGGFMEKPPE